MPRQCDEHIQGKHEQLLKDLKEGQDDMRKDMKEIRRNMNEVSRITVADHEKVMFHHKAMWGIFTAIGGFVLYVVHSIIPGGK